MPVSAIGLILISTFLHAGWNLILRWQRDSHSAAYLLIVIVAVGLGPALGAELWGRRFPGPVWSYLALAGIFQALYYLGLVKGYQAGHFTVVYPIARAMPILLIAVADVVRGDAPTLIGWTGMVLVSLGCFIIPLESLRRFELAPYLNRTMIWIIVTALGTVGYTLIDNAAAELIAPGPWTAARYGIFEFSSTILFHGIILIVLGQSLGRPQGLSEWRWPVIGAFSMFGAYWLVLWSYQISLQTSYVVALRQFSIVIGVIIGTFLFREPAPSLRIGAASLIALGIGGIALGG